MAPSASEAAGAADAGPRVPLPEGNAALGCRVGVWWIDDAQYYHGTVKEFDPETGKAAPVQLLCTATLDRSLVALRFACLK